MNLNNTLLHSKELILNEWINKVFDTYPIESGNFLKNGKNIFSNPVGYNLANALGAIFDLIIERSKEASRTQEILENFIKIRVVQDFEPSITINFFNTLKKIIYLNVSSKLNKAEDFHNLLELYDFIDSIALMSVDIFVLLKSRIFEIKANEQKNRFGRMADRIMKKYGLDENFDDEK